MSQIKYIPDIPENLKQKISAGFPEPGTEIEFIGGEFAYPCFRERIDFANNNLIIGQTYKVKRTEVYSSWCAVWLDGFGEEWNDFFHFSLFKL